MTLLLGQLNSLHHMLPGADKSLDRPGGKQNRKHVMNARDFNKIETQAVVIFSARQGPEE